MDYKEATKALDRFIRKADKVEKAHREAVRAGERFAAYAWMLPHTEADDELPRPRVEIYQTKSGRWVGAVVLTEYASVNPEDALSYMPFSWCDSSGEGLPNRLEFNARFAAWELGLPLYYGDEVLNLPARTVTLKARPFREAGPVLVVSGPREDGRVWIVMQDEGKRARLATALEEEIEA